MCPLPMQVEYNVCYLYSVSGLSPKGLPSWEVTKGLQLTGHPPRRSQRQWAGFL